jgi:NADP-dependent 3-hydroxy acid dehydrogenase YdfG
VVEPGAVATELIDRNRDEVAQGIRHMLKDVEPLKPEDIANAVLYAIAQPHNVSINEVLVRPTFQER